MTYQDAAYNTELCRTQGASAATPFLVELMVFVKAMFDPGVTCELYTTDLDGSNELILLDRDALEARENDFATLVNLLESDKVFSARFTPLDEDAMISDVLMDAETATDNTLVSNTAGFTADDIGKTVTGAGIPADTQIATVVDEQNATLSKNTTATATDVEVTILERKAPSMIGDVRFIIRAEAL